MWIPQGLAIVRLPHENRETDLRDMERERDHVMDSPWVTREGTERWDTGFLALKVTPRLQMEVHCLGFG